MVVDLHTAQFRHRHRIHLGRRNLAIPQQLSGVSALGIGTAEIFTEPPGFELHIRAALIAFD